MHAWWRKGSKEFSVLCDRQSYNQMTRICLARWYIKYHLQSARSIRWNDSKQINPPICYWINVLCFVLFYFSFLFCNFFVFTSDSNLKEMLPTWIIDEFTHFPIHIFPQEILRYHSIVAVIVMWDCPDLQAAWIHSRTMLVLLLRWLKNQMIEAPFNLTSILIKGERWFGHTAYIKCNTPMNEFYWSS